MFRFCSSIVLIAVLALLSTTAAAVEPPLADFNLGAERLIEKCLPSLVSISNAQGGGSGFIVDREGYIFTNHHVSGDYYVNAVRTYDGEEYRAIRVGNDPSIDFCLLKILDPPDDLVPIALADSDKVKVGDLVMVMGSPGGSSQTTSVLDPDDPQLGWLDRNSCTLGVVNSRHGFAESQRFSAFYFADSMGHRYGKHLTSIFDLDAEVNAGNSGGPAVNSRGEVIAMNTYGGNTGSKYFESANWSVPINHHKKSAYNILNYGHARWPHLGIDILPRDFNNMGLVQDFGGINNPFREPDLADAKDGHLIRYVSPTSPAADAGLMVGDILLKYNGKAYANPLDICQDILMNNQVGDTVKLTVRRGERIIPAIEIELASKSVLDDMQIQFNENTYVRETF